MTISERSEHYKACIEHVQGSVNAAQTETKQQCYNIHTGDDAYIIEYGPIVRVEQNGQVEELTEDEFWKEYSIF